MPHKLQQGDIFVEINLRNGNISSAGPALLNSEIVSISEKRGYSDNNNGAGYQA